MVKVHSVLQYHPSNLLRKKWIPDSRVALYCMYARDRGFKVVRVRSPDIDIIFIQCISRKGQSQTDQTVAEEGEIQRLSPCLGIHGLFLNEIRYLTLQCKCGGERGFKKIPLILT